MSFRETKAIFKKKKKKFSYSSFYFHLLLLVGLNHLAHPGWKIQSFRFVLLSIILDLVRVLEGSCVFCWIKKTGGEEGKEGYNWICF